MVTTSLAPFLHTCGSPLSLKVFYKFYVICGIITNIVKRLRDMTASEKTICSILKDLTNVHENLLSLSDDIWNSIDHNDAEKFDEGHAFKKEFNRLLGKFEKNKNDISVLVSQFTDVKLDEQLKIVEKDNTENQRLIRKLNKNTPHEITEDFTFKKPTAFIFDGCAYPEMNCWSELYIQIK